MVREHDRESDDKNLDSREYTDSEGNVHHHTKSYMEGHDGESKKEGHERDESEDDRE